MGDFYRNEAMWDGRLNCWKQYRDISQSNRKWNILSSTHKSVTGKEDWIPFLPPLTFWVGVVGQTSSSTFTTDSDLFNIWSSLHGHWMQFNPVSFSPFNLHFTSMKFPLSQNRWSSTSYIVLVIILLRWQHPSCWGHVTEHLRLLENQRPETERGMKWPTKLVIHIRYCNEKTVILCSQTVPITNFRINWTFKSPPTQVLFYSITIPYVTAFLETGIEMNHNQKKNSLHFLKC